MPVPNGKSKIPLTLACGDFQYAHQQGLIGRRPALGELFENVAFA